MTSLLISNPLLVYVLRLKKAVVFRQIFSILRRGSPRRDSLSGKSIFTITLDEALALFANALPRTLGVYNDQEVIVGEGRYGAYVRYAGEFTSLPKNADPYTFSLEEAITLIENKKQAEEPIHVFGDIQVLNGRYGAYIKAPKGNFRIPKSTNVQTLTEEECLALINSSEPASTKKRFTRKK